MNIQRFGSTNHKKSGKIPPLFHGVIRRLLPRTPHLGLNATSITISDVARLAGVSTATVSRVVNGANNVSDETRERVSSAISNVQYFPNRHATELGRENGGKYLKSLARIQVLGDRQEYPSAPPPPEADYHPVHSETEQSRFMKSKYTRVMRKVAKLSKNLEKLSKDMEQLSKDLDQLKK